MGMCWWCYWGWPKPIMEIYVKAFKALGEDDSLLCYGPAHVVWEDENWESAQWCLDNFDRLKRAMNDDTHSDDQWEIVRQSLIELIAVPDEFKREPEGYKEDDNNPEDYPPPANWDMVR